MEKYGEIPKKFTSKWFEYVWDYYKIHITVAVLLIAAGIYTWYAISHRTVYDLTVCFAGDNVISAEANENFCRALEEIIEDVNGDGQKNVRIIETSVSENTVDYEYAQALETKFYLELQTGDTYLYIISEERADRLSADTSAEGLFEKTENWCGKTADKDFFINVGGSELLTSSGVLYGDLYAGVRNFRADESGEQNELKRKNAVLAATAILGE